MYKSNPQHFAQIALFMPITISSKKKNLHRNRHHYFSYFTEEDTGLFEANVRTLALNAESLYYKTMMSYALYYHGSYLCPVFVSSY